jgi:hypothetical protein
MIIKVHVPPFEWLMVNLLRLSDNNKLAKVIMAGKGERARVNLEKVQKIAKTVTNIELLIEFKNR